MIANKPIPHIIKLKDFSRTLWYTPS